VYAEDDYTWNQLEGYIEELIATYHRPVVYVTSDENDPRLEDSRPDLAVYCISETVPKFISAVDSQVFLTTMPDLDSFHIKRPRDATCVYAFHSLNSTHASYRTGAFDAYDVFMCVGPYHEAELTRRFQMIGKTDYVLSKVGYYKLDRIAAASAAYTKAYPDIPTVLLAPSWGEHNLLATVGSEIISSLAQAGYRTVVRPHPAFFESIYPQGLGIVEDLKQQFGSHDNVLFESGIASEDAFYEADLMISDWSGAAFEYALGTERPVLFVDVPRKVMNEDWSQLGIVPFEERIRPAVGEVLPMGNVARTAVAVQRLLRDNHEYRDRIVDVRNTEIYNFGSSALAGAGAINACIVTE
jgi:YidC/Oxa1 family membrane protein insertase